MTIEEPIEGKVARVVTTREVVINRGATHGVEKGMYFAIFDPRFTEIRDPDSGEPLGNIERRKAIVRVVEVFELMALAKTFRFRVVGGGLGGGVAALFEPRRRVYETLEISEYTSNELDEDDSIVKSGDPVKQVDYVEESQPD